MNEIFITSNWGTENEDDLQKVVSFTSSINDCSIENMSVENCVCLNRDDNACLDSIPQVEITSKYMIKQVDLYSEASLVEVFGKDSEYLFTSESTFIDDWEEMAVYHTRIILPVWTYCKLKFSKIKNKARLWLYNIKLSIDKSQKCSTSSVFNIEYVNQFLMNSSQPISEKARNFKTLFESYMNNLYLLEKFKNENNIKYENFLKAFDSKINLKTHQIKPKCILSSEAKIGQNHNNVPLLNNQLCSTCSNCKKDTLELVEVPECENLKNFINKKFIEMKEDILQNVELKLNELREENNANFAKVFKILKAMDMD